MIDDPTLDQSDTALAGIPFSHQSSFAGRHRRHSDPRAPDILGNLPLHHAFAHNPEISKIRLLVGEYPFGARIPNQFGRIPLHYAVDRSKVSVEAIKLLLEVFPEGASVKATDGMSPYDIGKLCKCYFSPFITYSCKMGTFASYFEAVVDGRSNSGCSRTVRSEFWTNRIDILLDSSAKS